MNSFLPDVNALLALLDPMHVHHEAAHQSYQVHSPLRLVTCSHVENGVIRVASQPKYPNCNGTASRVQEVLREFTRKLNTGNCKKEISLLDDAALLQPSLLTPSRVSDLYLLTLAASNGVRFTTFDTRIPAKAVAGGMAAFDPIPVSKGAAGEL